MPDDGSNFLPPLSVTRRRFLVSSLAAGFALAVRPVSAQTITTDLDGLTAGEVDISVADGAIPAYRAYPAVGGPFPVVLVVQEIFGVHEHIKDVCRRLAKLGYLAVAPELYARQGDVSRLTDIGQILTIVRQVPDAQVMQDLDATLGWVEQSGEGRADRAAITGFCWGGRIVWLYAAHNPRLKAGIAWYGRVVGENTDLTPQQPIDLAARLHAPVLGLYGGADNGIPLEGVERMRAALRAADAPANTSRIVVYPDTPHGFHADYRPSYRKDQATDGWNRLQAWLADNGLSHQAESRRGLIPPIRDGAET
jgi:carboxymethylenebutenolidase